MSNTTIATSDGILKKDWDITHELAVEIANAALSGSDKEEFLRNKMLAHLSSLTEIYGEKPSIIATKADYVKSTEQQIKLLESAYRLAELNSDYPNMTFIAHSLAQLNIEEYHNIIDGEYWLSIFALCLEKYNEEYEKKDYAILSDLLNSLKGTNQRQAMISDIDDT